MTLQKPLDASEKSRYSRQIMLPEMGKSGQQTLKNSHAVIFGLGGLGSPVSIYLAAAGIGHLTLVDFDCVDDSNLQRQIVHKEANIDQPKVHSAKQNILALNHHIKIDTVEEKLTAIQIDALIKNAQVVVDCTDNFATRFMLNTACLQQKKPLVSGAAIRWEGQVSTYDFREENSACYQCLYKDTSGQELTCGQNGVVSPVVGMIGTMQAVETIKVLLNLPTLAGKLMIVDAMTMKIRTLNLTRDKKCPSCQKS